MSRKRRPPWWNYVKEIIREYPALCERISRVLPPKTSGSIVQFRSSTGIINSPVEQSVIHDLPPAEQRKYEAVSKAIWETRRAHKQDAAERLKVVELVYWRKTHTIDGAAMEIPCHPNTAGKWQAEFIRLVAKELDLP